LRGFDPFSDIPLVWEMLGLAALALTAIAAWLRIRKAPSWPSAPGNITSTHVANQMYLGWAFVLTYNYNAQSGYYSGSRQLHAWSRKRAEELASALKGLSITVRYSEVDHAISALLKDDQVGGFGTCPDCR
jgi:hypothetical protein